jgi:hypothetical protein
LDNKQCFANLCANHIARFLKTSLTNLMTLDCHANGHAVQQTPLGEAQNRRPNMLTSVIPSMYEDGNQTYSRCKKKKAG